MRRARRVVAFVAGATFFIAAANLALAQTGVGVSPEAADAQQQPQARPPAPPPITLASRPGATGGEALYIEKCIMCHGPNGMGTGLLARTRPVALLDARDNLTAQFVIVAARQGIGNMPAIPRGEVPDEQLQAIADYLAAGPHLEARGGAGG